LKKLDEFVIRLGINEHYKSISRGIIDIKDVVYFIAIAVFFNEATRFKLVSRKWKSMS
jgi:ABC-2 type transport system permease protein